MPSIFCETGSRVCENKISSMMSEGLLKQFKDYNFFIGNTSSTNQCRRKSLKGTFYDNLNNSQFFVLLMIAISKNRVFV